MKPTEIVEAERRRRPWVVPVTALAALLTLLSYFGSGAVLGGSSNFLSQQVTTHEKPTAFLALGVATALGSALLAGTLFHLFRATQARQPTLKNIFLPLGVIGALALAVSEILGVASSVTIANRFVSEGGQTYQQLSDLSGKPLPVITNYLGFLASLLLGAAIVVIALNALRAGLLPRVLGYIGIAAGVLSVLRQLPILPVPVLLAFWLGALAVLFSGRWPSGHPPAWSTGRAEPWPTMQQQRELAAAGGSPGRGRFTPEPAPTPPRPPATPARPGATRQKRKRKR